MALQFDLDVACEHLSSVDPIMAGLIDSLPPMHINASLQGSSFEALLRAINGQQLSVKAAATIHGRFLDLFPKRRPVPHALLALPEDSLRGAGLSRNKTLAVQDLAAKCLDGTVPSLTQLDGLADEEIIQRLVQVRGIGRWTAEMLLIFQLGRPDILPVDDLGVQRGYKVAYNKRALPKPKAFVRHGQPWKPYRSVAAWYLWRAGDAQA